MKKLIQKQYMYWHYKTSLNIERLYLGLTLSVESGEFALCSCSTNCCKREIKFISFELWSAWTEPKKKFEAKYTSIALKKIEPIKIKSYSFKINPSKFGKVWTSTHFVMHQKQKCKEMFWLLCTYNWRRGYQHLQH